LLKIIIVIVVIKIISTCHICRYFDHQPLSWVTSGTDALFRRITSDLQLSTVVRLIDRLCKICVGENSHVAVQGLKKLL